MRDMNRNTDRDKDAEGWVLAGGQSRRMGRDKAALSLAGVPMLQRMLEKLAALKLKPQVAGLQTVPIDLQATVIEDAHPGCGPLSGIETALRHSHAALVLVVSVDLPLVSTELLDWMLERAAATGALATIPRLLGEAQPLCAVYRRELLESVSHALLSGDFKVMRAIEHGSSELGGRVDLFDVERLASTAAWSDAWPLHWQLLNCNTPDDLALAETLLTQARFLPQTLPQM